VSGAAVPNATIIMTNNKANVVEMTASDAAGNFGFKTLPAGEYEMKAAESADSWSTKRRKLCWSPPRSLAERHLEK